MEDRMGFGTALTLLERGRKVARKGWNGKGMYLFLTEGSVPRAGVQFSVTASAPERLPIDAAICMRTAQGTIQPGWLASQADMLAKDWIEVE